MDLLSALLASTPTLDQQQPPEQEGPDIEIPQIEDEQDPIGGFDPDPEAGEETELYEGHWAGGAQARSMVSGWRIGPEVREDLGIDEHSVVMIYAMDAMPGNASSVFVTVDGAGWESWTMLAQPEPGDDAPSVTALITTEVYMDGMMDLFDPEGSWERRGLEHALMVDVELLSDDARNGLDPETPYVLAAPTMEAMGQEGDFRHLGEWSVAEPAPSETPWADFSNYATTRPDESSSVGSMAYLGQRAMEGRIELGSGWEMRVSWDQGAPWDEEPPVQQD